MVVMATLHNHSKDSKISGVPLEAFSTVVEAIYDCALDPNHWGHALRMIADLLGSQRCVLGVHDCANDRSQLAFQLGYEDEEYWTLHEGKYRGMNPHFPAVLLMPVGAVATSAMLVDQQEFLESRFYREWCKPQGLRDAIAVKVLQTGQRMGLLAANRLATCPRYGPTEIRLLTLLAPHICRAVTISDALNLKTIRSEALEATLDALASGVYLIDRQYRVIYMNRMAEQQVRSGQAIRIENQHLAPVARVAHAAMSMAIAEATADEAATPAGGTTIALPDNEGAGLIATVLPLNRGERRNLCRAFAATAAIFVQDPVVVLPFPGEAFAELYALTGGELRVLLAMAPGLAVKEAAEMLGIGETTAKTHLQRIYAKTGTSKQTELMHLFMNSTPPVATA
jgi:DNA-binding CsgD family transcriptional regulator/PAS domain-containing protein